MAAVGGGITALPAEGGAEFGEREDRAVPADEDLAELAVAAQADTALHVPLQRHEDAVVGDAAVAQDVRGRLASSAPGRR